MEYRVAEFTVRVVLPEIEGLMMEVAVMVVVVLGITPATARPVLGSIVGIIVATFVADELQLTCVGNSVPSLYVPMAVNFSGTPIGMGVLG
jgi:hypothetical protein